VYESYHLVDEVPPSTALAFVTKMSEKGKSTSRSAIQVKNWRKTVGTEDEFDIISWLEKRLTDCWYMPYCWIPSKELKFL